MTFGVSSDWTDDRVATLKELWAAGKSANEIADAIGMSRNAVIGKARRLGLEARKSPIVRPKRTPAATPGLLECQWPHGEPGKPGFHFCGDAVQPGYPYCSVHKARAYRKWERKDEEAA